MFIFEIISITDLTLDAMDSSGDQHLHIEHNIFKRRLDLQGNPIEEAKKEDIATSKTMPKKEAVSKFALPSAIIWIVENERVQEKQNVDGKSVHSPQCGIEFISQSAEVSKKVWKNWKKSRKKRLEFQNVKVKQLYSKLLTIFWQIWN